MQGHKEVSANKNDQKRLVECLAAGISNANTAVGLGVFIAGASAATPLAMALAGAAAGSFIIGKVSTVLDSYHQLKDMAEFKKLQDVALNTALLVNYVNAAKLNKNLNSRYGNKFSTSMNKIELEKSERDKAIAKVGSTHQYSNDYVNIDINEFESKIKKIEKEINNSQIAKTAANVLGSASDLTGKFTGMLDLVQAATGPIIQVGLEKTGDSIDIFNGARTMQRITKEFMINDKDVNTSASFISDKIKSTLKKINNTDIVLLGSRQKLDGNDRTKEYSFQQNKAYLFQTIYDLNMENNAMRQVASQPEFPQMNAYAITSAFSKTLDELKQQNPRTAFPKDLPGTGIVLLQQACSRYENLNSELEHLVAPKSKLQEAKNTQQDVNGDEMLANSETPDKVANIIDIAINSLNNQDKILKKTYQEVINGVLSLSAGKSLSSEQQQDKEKLVQLRGDITTLSGAEEHIEFVEKLKKVQLVDDVIWRGHTPAAELRKKHTDLRKLANAYKEHSNKLLQQMKDAGQYPAEAVNFNKEDLQAMLKQQLPQKSLKDDIRDVAKTFSSQDQKQLASIKDSLKGLIHVDKMPDHRKTLPPVRNIQSPQKQRGASLGPVQ